MKNKTDCLLSRNACVKLDLVHRVKPDSQEQKGSQVSQDSQINVENTVSNVRPVTVVLHD